MAKKETRLKAEFQRPAAPLIDEELSIEVLKSPVEPPDPAALTVHLIHHSSEVLLRFFDFLSEAGFRVSASSNGDDGLAMVARSAPKCLVAEMDLPEMSGMELSLRTGLASPSTRLILLSDYPDGNAAMIAKASGAREVVDKRIPPESLLLTIRRVTGLG